MPNRDGTGPMGKGPRTGRGLGKCAKPKSSKKKVIKKKVIKSNKSKKKK